MAVSESAASLRRLFDRLTCYKVLNWGVDSNAPDMTDRDVARVEDADVVSSLHRNRTNEGRRHALVIDIDHPAWLVKSTTPGHHHLYVDVPGGIPDTIYMALLGTLADAGVIEHGYAGASQQRRHSDVRLPWIKKPAPGQPITGPDAPRRAPDWADEPTAQVQF